MKHILKPIPTNNGQYNYWKTKDLHLASYIYSQQIDLIKVERENKTCWFYFRDGIKCEELQSLYWSNKGQTVPKIYADILVRMMFERDDKSQVCLRPLDTFQYQQDPA